MITITRRLAKQLRTVVSRALPTRPRKPAPTLMFVATEDRLQVRMLSEEVAVTYEEPGEFIAAELVVPLQLLRDCEGSRSDTVELQLSSDNTLLSRWMESGVAQSKVYERPPNPDFGKWPSLPSNLVENSGQLLVALRDASETADSQSSRYALGHIQLRGQKGEIVATDGKQLLLERGFEFPWKDNLLVAGNRVFGSSELLSSQSAWVGCTEDWVTLRAGRWTLQFAVHKEGRFPRVDDVVRKAAEATSSCQVSPNDLLHLQRSMRLLPGDDAVHAPVTLDLNGHLAVRAKADWMPQPTEIQLESSRPTGEPIRIATDRRYLERAARLGLSEFYFFGPENPILAQDNRRSYIWMALSPKLVIPPSGYRVPLATAA